MIADLHFLSQPPYFSVLMKKETLSGVYIMIIPAAGIIIMYTPLSVSCCSHARKKLSGSGETDTGQY